jgi:hypothetical protein
MSHYVTSLKNDPKTNQTVVHTACGADFVLEKNENGASFPNTLVTLYAPDAKCEDCRRHLEE